MIHSSSPVATENSVEISVIVPFYNEEENVQPLYQELVRALSETGCIYEIIFIDDGSHDKTLKELLGIAATDKTVCVVPLIRNFGQTAAMMAGFDAANGAIIIAMDGDGQNDPANIPDLLAEMEKGYDVVSGWRKDRKDKTISRKLPSWLANRLI